MKVELTKEWCMNMANIEARAAELHENCRMPMEQARELAVSEASPDWYARGQDWGLADALTAGQDGDWTLDDIARAFAAGAQAGAAIESKRAFEFECRCVALEEQADLTAIELNRLRESEKALVSTLRDEMDEGLRLREMGGAWPDEGITAMTERIVSENARLSAEAALLRAALNGGNVIERLQFALQRLADASEALGVNHFGKDWRSEEVLELHAATHAARLVLGPNRT